MVLFVQMDWIFVDVNKWREKFSYDPTKILPAALESVLTYRGATWIALPLPCIWSFNNCCFNWCCWICSRSCGESADMWFCEGCMTDCWLCGRFNGDKSLYCVGEPYRWWESFCLFGGEIDRDGLDGESKPWSRVIPESKSVSSQEFCVRFFEWCTWGADGENASFKHTDLFMKNIQKYCDISIW